MEFKFEVQKGEVSDKDINKLKKAITQMFGSRWGKVKVTAYAVPEHPLSESIRGYYWMLCDLIAKYQQELGTLITKAQVHEMHKKVYFSQTFMDLVKLEAYDQEQSHKGLSNKELLDTCELIKQDWAERGLNLPDINQNRGNDGLNY